jgi:hypothetical protein
MAGELVGKQLLKLDGTEWGAQRTQVVLGNGENM